MSIAKIDIKHGTPAIEINDESFSLMAMTTRIGDEEYIRSTNIAIKTTYVYPSLLNFVKPVKLLLFDQFIDIFPLRAYATVDPSALSPGSRFFRFRFDVI